GGALGAGPSPQRRPHPLRPRGLCLPQPARPESFRPGAGLRRARLSRPPSGHARHLPGARRRGREGLWGDGPCHRGRSPRGGLAGDRTPGPEGRGHGERRRGAMSAGGDRLRVGLTHEATYTVTPDMRPPHFAGILSTSRMISLVEDTCLELVQPLLAEGETTVGTRV